MADLRTKFCGKVLQSPFILGSGPAGFDAENLYLHYKAGAGAVVTKSISIDGCKNTTRHMMANGKDCLINNEGGSDLPMKQWLDVELPKAKELGVGALIASVYGNGNLKDTLHIACECERAGADMLEVVTDYHNPADFVEKIGTIKKKVQIPIIAKVNSNWNNTEEVADACVKSGVDAITAIDSVGPVYRVDIATGKPIMGGKGYGYMTGAPILPIALRYVHDIAKSTEKPILGLGGDLFRKGCNGNADGWSFLCGGMLLSDYSWSTGIYETDKRTGRADGSVWICGYKCCIPKNNFG